MVLHDGEESEDEMVVIVPREGWEARRPKSKKPMKMPIRDFVYTETDTKECRSRQDCSKLLKEMQNYHIDVRGLPDIQHNFLIASDGTVYEGRGWHAAGPEYPKSGNIPYDLTGKTAEIAFIGRFRDKEPSQTMLKAAQKLLKHGFKTQKVMYDGSRDGGEESEEGEEEEEEKNDENDEEGAED